MMNLIFTGKGGTGNAGTDNSFDPCKSFYQNYAKGKSTVLTFPRCTLTRRELTAGSSVPLCCL